MDILQRLFKSLSGKTRLEILLLLLEKGELTVKEIATSLNRKMNTISQNLKILERDNFVKFRHTSIHTYYSIKKDKNIPTMRQF
jgi:DNA-binding transcriptional ArsR family regulator